MRVGKIDWVMHNNMPILSVDVQPNGFRFVTGGADHKVCIWNLLPVISEKYEKMGAKKKNAQEDKKIDGIIDQEMKESHQQSTNKEQNDNSQDQYDFDAQEGYRDDIKIMESLFESEKKRSQRLLSVLDSHSNPVNCVRWNNIGTLFASASDDGSVLLWEYVGEMMATAFQKFQMSSASSSGQQKMQFFEEKKTQGLDGEDEEDQENEEQMLEEWRNKRSWHGHKGGVSDLAWCPDNIHFASCGTDSQIIIWSINEQSAIKHIDQKANGLTFDPFGKFMASQSSEDRSLIIWRVQGFKNLSKECEHTSYYKQSMSQSLFRRLSWSSDGQFISTTAGKVGNLHIAPLIERSSWNQLASLSGHSKTITTSRINPRLFRSPESSKEFDASTGQYNETLSCYSVVALASIDSTISIWKPYMDKPFTVVMDIFKMGITDLSWGFNGNILLASSNDGQIFSMHFKPGILGSPISELEKQLIIEKKYGTTILNDYKKYTKLQGSSMTILPSTLNNSQQQQPRNLTGDKLKEQQKETLKSNGKKKIVPVMVKQYNESANINPFLNPFQNQMLSDTSANQDIIKAQLAPQTNTSDLQIQSEQQKQAPPQQEQMPPLEITKAYNMKLPSFNQAFGGSTENTVITTQAKSQIMSSPVNVKMEMNPPSGIGHQKNVQPTQQVQVQEEEKENLLDASGKKTKKSKRKKEQQDVSYIQQQQQQINQVISNAGVGVSSLVPAAQAHKIITQQSSFLNQNNQSYLASKEQLQQLERILELSKGDIITAIPLEKHQHLMSLQDKEHMQINLPARDVFSEEIRVFITNVDLNAFNRRAEVKVYNSDNIEVSHQNIEREFVILTTVCASFYVMYTNQGQLLIYSTRTTQLVNETSLIFQVKSGLIQEGVCFLDSCEQAQCFVVVTLKGIVSVYKVNNPDYAAIDTCTMQWQANFTEILKIKTQQTQALDPANKPVYIKYIKMLKDGGVMLFLTDSSVYEYDVQMVLWRQVNSNIDLSQIKSQEEQKKNKGSAVAYGDNQEESSISSVIKLLELQSLEDQKQQQINVQEGDVEMASQVQPEKKQLTYLIETQLQKIAQMQESLSIFDRLTMKNEFLYTLRMYTTLIISVGDFLKLKDLMLDYRFLTTWEEEQQLNSTDQLQQSTLHGKNINKESAIANLLNLMADEEEEEAGFNNVSGSMINEKGRIIRVDDKKYFLICGMEKREVFQQAILPVLKTLSQTGQEIKDILAHIIKIISENNTSQNQQKLMSQDPPQPLPSDQDMGHEDYQQHMYQVMANNAQQQQFGLMLPSIQNFFPSYVTDGSNTDLQELQQQMLQAVNQNAWPYMQMTKDQAMVAPGSGNNSASASQINNAKDNSQNKASAIQKKSR